MLVAGGSNFGPGGTPWNGATKTWYDNIFALETLTGTWKKVGKLPVPLGYGVSVSWHGKLICIGGNNASGHFADVFMLQYKNGIIATEKLPALPKTNANASGVVIGNVIYIAGGQEKPDSKTTEKVFWSLDLSQKHKQWQKLPAWPGASRMLSVAGTQNGEFYLFGGTELVADEQGNPQRKFLTDAYRYNSETGWAKLADLPEPIVAAPSPVFASGQSDLLIFGGDNGRYFKENATLKARHPGFSDTIWAYHCLTDSWSIAGKIPTYKHTDAVANPNASVWAPVTTPLAVWHGDIILAGGEVRPGTRTNRVLKVTVCESN